MAKKKTTKCPSCGGMANVTHVGKTGPENISCSCGFILECFENGDVKRIFFPGNPVDTSQERRKIEQFEGEYLFLSNFSTLPQPIIYSKKEYPTTEHLFHAMKTDDPEWREKIRTAPSPGKGTPEAPGAKALGRQVALRENWEDIKLDVMRLCLKLKFAIPELRKKFLATGDAILIEGNTWNDQFWGVCNGQGKNMLGRLLMELRSYLAQGKEPWPGLCKCLSCDHARKAGAEDFVGCIRWLYVSPGNVQRSCVTENDLPSKVREVGAHGWVYLSQRPDHVKSANDTADTGVMSNNMLVVPATFRCSDYKARENY